MLFEPAGGTGGEGVAGRPEGDDGGELAAGVCRLLAGYASRPADAMGAATELAEPALDVGEGAAVDVPQALEAVACGLALAELHRRKMLPALVGGAVFPSGSLPEPKLLPPQELVELLKRPFVVGERRRAVLDVLEITYGRRFADLWAFVDFAEAEHKELDLLSPPKR